MSGIKIQYHATVGYVRTIDRVCPTCKGIWSSRENATCPKCGISLVQMTATTEKNGVRPSCFTEIVLYPIIPEKEKVRYSEKMTKSKSLPFSIRLKLWGHYDEVNNVALQDNRVAHLPVKRTVLVDIGTVPLYSMFMAKGNTPVVQVLHEITSEDKITFLGSKESYEIADKEIAKSAPPAPPVEKKVVTSPTPDSAVIQLMQKQMDTMAKLMESVLATKSAPVETTKEVIVESDAPDPGEHGCCIESPMENTSGYDGETLTLFAD